MRIDVDGVHETPVEVLPHVEVADFGAARRAAAHGLVEHLLFDVFSALADLDFVHNVGDRFHGIGHVALTEIFLGRDELHTHARKDALGDSGVSQVSEGTRTHVDHDIADLGMMLDVAQHLAKDRPLTDRLGRVAGLDELLSDRGLGAFSAHDASLALRRDRVAIRIDIDGSQHLPGVRHAEVDHRLPFGSLPDGRRCGAVETQQALPSRE
nr:MULTISPECIES: hypothetical protein [unclassified Microbacterium]